MNKLNGIGYTIKRGGFLLIFACRALFAGEAPTQKPDRVIMFIIDGLAVGAMDRIEMPRLRQLAQEGTHYRAMHLPLPGHPEKSEDYPWSSSMANPMLMSGTPFIGLDGIREAMIQHQFQEKETAFVVNAFSYVEVSGGFDTYISTPHRRDALVIDNTKEVMLEKNPVFLRVHLQRPGTEGEKVSKERYADEPFYRNIWHEQSLYRIACERADLQLGRFVDWLKEQNLWEGTVLLIFGDHGQADEGWHEPYSPPSSITPLIVSGQGVASGRTLDYSEIIDIVPTIAWLLGREAPAHSLGRILREAFDPDLPAPDTPRRIEQLNHLLRYVNSLDEDAQQSLKRAGFLTIDEIGLWHQTEAGTNLDKFVERQRAIVETQLPTADAPEREAKQSHEPGE